MTRPQATTLALVLLALAAGLLALNQTPRPRPSAPAASTLPPPPTPAPSHAATPVVVETAADDELAAAVDAFLSAVPVSPVESSPGPTAKEAWRRHREGNTSALDFARDLELALRAHGPAGAAELLLTGMHDADEPELFVAAKALAGRIDRPTALRLLRDLPSTAPEVRRHAVFALRGAVEPEVDEALVGLYTDDSDPRVRARAGSNLADRLERLDPEQRQRTLTHAREQLHAEDPEQVETAADVLGGAPLEPHDRSQLEALVTTDVDPQRRIAALRALATSGLTPADLRGVLQQVRSDPSAGDQLQAMARQLLGE